MVAEVTMQVKVITLKYDHITGKIDDSSLTDFIKDKEVISVRDHFFMKDGCPYLVMVITYKQNVITEPASEKKSKGKNKDKWRDLIDEDEMSLFNTIREWRTERARQDGVPSYVICNNLEIAHMIKKMPQSLNKLSEIEGFGKDKIEKYGRELLNLLSEKIQVNENERTE